MKKEHFIKEFRELSKNDASSAGGKGASLGEMTQAGIPVPPGFVILATAFERFIRETDIHCQIDAILHKVNHQAMHTVEQASEEIKALILSAQMPKPIAQKILVAFKKLDARFVAVRSSATAEDSSTAAWAGQLESYLNTPKENLLDNVKKCWASLFTPRAIFYRFEQNMHQQHISVAVVVQKMVESEISGIAFSVHPVTTDYNQLIIEAGLGLGEAIVSGQVTPDSYVVEKKGWEIVEKNVAIQTKALYRRGNSGNGWKEISGSEQKLSEAHIIGLSKLIVKIEEHYGFPCDIEWAWEKGRFYIVQSRPITTLIKKEVIKINSHEYHKLMTRPLDLISCECWDIGERLVLPRKFKNLVYYTPLFIMRQHQGVSVYYDFTDPAQNPLALLKFLDKNKEYFQQIERECLKQCKEIKMLLQKKSKDYRRLFTLITEIWAIIAISNILSANDSYSQVCSSTLKKLFLKVRKETDNVSHPALTHLSTIISERIRIEYPKIGKYTQYILVSEYLTEPLRTTLRLGP